MNIKLIIRNHRKGVFVILFLILLENVAWMFEPELFGNLIDAFIKKSSEYNITFELIFLPPLLLWVSAYLINSLSGTLRKKMEPRVYQNMYLDIVDRITDKNSNLSNPPSKTTAHAQLSQEYITLCSSGYPI